MGQVGAVEVDEVVVADLGDGHAVVADAGEGVERDLDLGGGGAELKRAGRLRLERQREHDPLVPETLTSWTEEVLYPKLPCTPDWILRSPAATKVLPV